VVKGLLGAALKGLDAIGYRKMAGRRGATDAPAAQLTKTQTEPSSDGSGLEVTINAAAGGPLSTNPSKEIKESLPGATIVEASADEFPDVVRRAAAGEAAAIGVAGGDGSINAAAEAAHDENKPLVIFPAGTLNHLARDLGLESISDSVDALHLGEAAAVDLGRIDGRPFLNTASFGTYSRLVDIRERLEDRIGKWPALIYALIRVLREGQPLTVELNGKRMKIWMIFIGNCVYQPDGMIPRSRARLDDGLFDVRWVRADLPWSRVRILAGLLPGTIERGRVFGQLKDKKVSVKILEGTARLARDGETFDGSNEFQVEKASRPIAIFVPYSRRK
jgi:diacylglycerol kinase family enzyme